jgi:hypothetical protein
MQRIATNQAETTDWSSRIDPLIARYRNLVPFIAQEDAALAVSAVARMILAVERARAAGSRATVAVAEDSILNAGKLLEMAGEKTQRDEP